jgi:glycosyltransferase involved in cell wall biosynthesis
MKLLIINYEMDEDSGVLAWQARIAREIAHSCEFVLVLTEKIGRYTKAGNLHVELFDPKPLGLTRRFGGTFLLNVQARRLCRQYQIDTCFIHMAADWTYYLYPTFRMLRIPTVLWYAHGTVTRRLRLAHACATRVVTSTPDGFRIPSEKVRIIGQGIDTEIFQPLPAANETSHTEPRSALITVSRISRRKRIGLLLQVMAHLQKIPNAPKLHLRIVGPLLTPDDLAYDRELRAYAWQTGLQESVEFAGFVPQAYHSSLYRTAFLHLNVSQTGSMDKTVLEALACGCPVLVSNEAFRALLADYPEFIITDDRPEAIAAQIVALYSRLDAYDPMQLRNLVVGQHDLPSYAQKLLAQLKEVATL